MAPPSLTGQWPMHQPQPMQTSSLTFGRPSSMAMAPYGQTVSQVPQPVHLSS